MQQNGLIQLEVYTTQSLDNGKFCSFMFYLNKIQNLSSSFLIQWNESNLKNVWSNMFRLYFPHFVCLCIFTFRDLNWDSRSKRYAQKSRTFIHISKETTNACLLPLKCCFQKGRKDILCLLLFRNRGSVFWYLRQQVERMRLEFPFLNIQ